MKFITFIVTILLLFCSTSFAQERTTASGGEAIGMDGTVSFSVGLIDYTSISGSNGSLSAGVQQVYISSVGIEEWDLSYAISVFPNPTTSFVVVKVPNSDHDFYFSLTDANGKIIQKGILNETENQISLENVNPANYFLSILTNEQTIRTFKIIKTH